jgi:hypothetical protein
MRISGDNKVQRISGGAIESSSDIIGTPGMIANKTGNRIYLGDIDENDINILDITQRISRINRWNCATKINWTVGQHSLMAYEIAELLQIGLTVREKGALKIACIMHDFTEAYIGDLIRPVKKILGGKIESIEGEIWQTIKKAFGVSKVITEDIEKKCKMIDDICCWIEGMEVACLDSESIAVIDRDKSKRIGGRTYEELLMLVREDIIVENPDIVAAKIVKYLGVTLEKIGVGRTTGYRGVDTIVSDLRKIPVYYSKKHRFDVEDEGKKYRIIDLDSGLQVMVHKSEANYMQDLRYYTNKQ